MKVVKAATQVLNTLWQYRELRTLYKQVGSCRTSCLRLPGPWPDHASTSLCRTAGTTPTSSPPSPPWSETGTSPSPRCPPAPCGRRPSSSQVSPPARAAKGGVRKPEKLCRPRVSLRGQRHVFAGSAGLQETQFQLPEGAVIYATGHLLRGQQFTPAAAHRLVPGELGQKPGASEF